MRLSRIDPSKSALWPHLIVLMGLFHGCTAMLDFDSKDTAIDGWLTTECDLLLGVDEENLEDAFDAEQTVLLGALMPRSGALADSAPDRDHALDLALREINQNGGLGGKDIAVLSCDTGSDPDAALIPAAHLVDVVGVAAILGPSSSAVTQRVYSKVTEEAGVLLISPAATAMILKTLDTENLIWRTATSDEYQGRAIAEILNEAHLSGLERIAIIHRADTYGTGLRDVIHDEYCSVKGNECTSTGDEQNWFARGYDTTPAENGQYDFSSFLDLDSAAPDTYGRLQANGETYEAELLVVIGYPDDGLELLGHLHTEGLQKIIVTDAMDSPLLESSDLAAETRCLLVGTGVKPDEDGALYQEFMARYMAKAKNPLFPEEGWQTPDADPDRFVAHVYDAAYLLAYSVYAIETVGDAVTGAKIAMVLGHLSEAGAPAIRPGSPYWTDDRDVFGTDSYNYANFEGVSGPLDLSSDGEAPNAVRLWAYVDGIQTQGIVLDKEGVYLSQEDNLQAAHELCLGADAEP